MESRLDAAQLDRHRAVLTKYAMRAVSDADLAQDLVQDTFVAALATAYVYDDKDIPIDGALILTHVYDCGRDRAESCAQRLLVILDREIGYLREKWPTLYKRL